MNTLKFPSRATQIAVAFTFIAAICGASAQAQILPPPLPPMPTAIPTPFPMPPSLTPIPYPSAAPIPVPATPVAAAPVAAVAQSAIASGITQWHGEFYQGDKQSSTAVYKTNEAWSLLWKKVLEKEAPMPLNEDAGMAVYIAIGECPTGSYMPRVISAVAEDGKLVVTYTRGKPPGDAIVQQVVTYPWVVAIIPKSTLPVVFKEI